MINLDAGNNEVTAIATLMGLLFGPAMVLMFGVDLIEWFVSTMFNSDDNEKTIEWGKDEP